MLWVWKICDCCKSVPNAPKEWQNTVWACHPRAFDRTNLGSADKHPRDLSVSRDVPLGFGTPIPIHNAVAKPAIGPAKAPPIPHALRPTPGSPADAPMNDRSAKATRSTSAVELPWPHTRQSRLPQLPPSSMLASEVPESGERAFRFQGRAQPASS